MSTLTKTTIKTLALDLEGTLISNAMSQFARHGLCEFLNACDRIFGQDNIVIFTTVNEQLFRRVAAQLYQDGQVPEWFVTMQYIKWQGECKDLHFVDQYSPESVLLVDDYEGVIHPDQKEQWIAIKQFAHPYEDDMELMGVYSKIRNI